MANNRCLVVRLRIAPHNRLVGRQSQSVSVVKSRVQDSQRANFRSGSVFRTDHSVEEVRSYFQLSNRSLLEDVGRVVYVRYWPMRYGLFVNRLFTVSIQKSKFGNPVGLSECSLRSHDEDLNRDCQHDFSSVGRFARLKTFFQCLEVRFFFVASDFSANFF